MVAVAPPSGLLAHEASYQNFAFDWTCVQSPVSFHPQVVWFPGNNNNNNNDNKKKNKKNNNNNNNKRVNKK